MAREQLSIKNKLLKRKEQSKAQTTLKKYYGQLLAMKRNELRGTPSKRLLTLQKRLEDTFELLNLWQSYCDVIYMSEPEAQVITALKSKDIRPQELSYKNRQQTDDIQNRLNTLFGGE